MIEKRSTNQPAEDAGVIIPEGHEKKKDPDEHDLYEIVAVGNDTTQPLKKGDLVVLEEGMIETVKINGEIIQMIQENYLKAQVRLPS
jgi:co-chaperonin GroES (HSP10)